METDYLKALTDKEELLAPIRQEFYLSVDVRADYLEYLLKKAATLMRANFGICYTGESSQKIILQDLVRHFYKGGSDKDVPNYLKRMINQEKLKGDQNEAEN